MYRIDIYYKNIESTAYASNREDAVAIAKYYATKGGADIAKIYRYRRAGGMRWVGTCIGQIKLFAWGE
jgi:hypothetical protein